MYDISQKQKLLSDAWNDCMSSLFKSKQKF